jgi:hypothetical protein
MFDDQKLQSNDPVGDAVVETVSNVPKAQLANKKKSKWVFIIIGLLIVVVLVVGGVVVVKSNVLNVFTGEDTENSKTEQSINGAFETTDVDTSNEAAGSVILEVINEVTTPTVDLSKLDTDGDGLTDVEEMELGTDYNNLDSDDDGLTDFQETKKYETDPLSKDTDGDTYFDGEEVKNGYNPNGPGKLLNLN